MENIDKIKCVLIDFEQNEKTLDEAANEILRLFSVVGQSEQLVCEHPDEALIRDKPTEYCMACGMNI
jgi:hypothetical protein